MPNFPQVDMAIACSQPRFPGDVEPQRMSRLALKNIAGHDGGDDYAYSWGYTMFRTVYGPGSDEAVAEAVERLAVYATFFARGGSIWPRTGEAAAEDRPDEELTSRYYCELVEDEESLANISESDVGERFDAWIREHRHPVASAHNEPSPRFLFCLMLDEDSVENILALPEQPRGLPSYTSDTAGRDEACWVKVISNRMKTEDEGGSGRWWLRVGVADYLWSIWFIPFDPEVYVEEMGWPDAEDRVQNLWGPPDHWGNQIMAAHVS